MAFLMRHGLHPSNLVHILPEMLNMPHLDRAPIVEALIHFEANTAENWDPKAVRELLQPAWPEHTQIQEVSPVQIELKHELGKTPEQKISFTGVEALFFRAPGQPTVYQARRDGLVVSWLAPYLNWVTFRNEALSVWDKFQSILKPKELHSVTMRYINQFEFPAVDFKLADYFTAPPPKPPALGDWGFAGFQHITVFRPPNSGCDMQVIFARTVPSSDTVILVLDIETRLREPLAVTGRSKEEALEEMHALKNQAFFGMLTPLAQAQYK